MSKIDELINEFCPECKCQYKNAQKVENKNVRFPGSIPQLVLP